MPEAGWEPSMPEAILRDSVLRDHMVEAVTAVLETMCFAMVSPEEAVENAESLAAALLTYVQVSFSGARRGRFILASSRDAARVLAPDFLGLDPGEEPSDSGVEEVLAELANMICGATLSRLDPQAI